MQDSFTYLAHRITLGSDGAITLYNRLSEATLRLPSSLIGDWPLYDISGAGPTSLRSRDMTLNVDMLSERFCVLRYHGQRYVMPLPLLAALHKAISAWQHYAPSLTPRLCVLLHRLSRGVSPENLFPKATPVALAG